MYYDSVDSGAFVVVVRDGKEIWFHEWSNGLYVYDTASPQNTSQHGVVLVNTVADNASRYTPTDYSRAQKSRQVQVVIGRPSLKDYMHIVHNNLLPNCPITAQDTMAAKDIFGPKIGSLQGKTTRRQPHQVNPVWVPILPTVHERYKDVTLGGDVMFVNGQPFLTTISRNIYFGIAKALSDQSNKSLIAAFQNVRRIYSAGRFRIQFILLDGQFETACKALPNALKTDPNITGQDEHVGDIKRYIGVVKQRVQSIYNTLLFKRLPIA